MRINVGGWDYFGSRASLASPECRSLAVALRWFCMLNLTKSDTEICPEKKKETEHTYLSSKKKLSKEEIDEFHFLLKRRGKKLSCCITFLKGKHRAKHSEPSHQAFICKHRLFGARGQGCSHSSLLPDSSKWGRASVRRLRAPNSLHPSVRWKGHSSSLLHPSVPLIYNTEAVKVEPSPPPAPHDLPGFPGPSSPLFSRPCLPTLGFPLCLLHLSILVSFPPVQQFPSYSHSL